MKKRLIGILIAAIFAFCAAIFIGQPSNATSAVERQMLALGLVDEITTPEKLGLSYLGQQPVQLVANSKLMDSIKGVNSGLSVMPEDVPMTFPAGTNSPIKIRELSSNDTNNTADNIYEYTGFVSAQNQSAKFTPKDGADMTNIEYRNGGNIPLVTASSQQILIADARNLFLQAKRIPTFSVILRNKRLNKRYLVRDINANAVCRDLLNAALTGNLRSLTTGEILIG
jgi:hypothetical protein